MKYFCHFVVRHPRTVIGFTLAVTLLLGFQFANRRVKLDGSPETLIIKHDAAREFYEMTRAAFGDDRIIIVAAEVDELFSPDNIANLRRLTDDLLGVAGVAQAVGLTTVQYLRNSGDTIKVGDLVPRGAGRQELAEIGQEVRTNPLFTKQLISPDGRTTAINLILRNDLNDSARRAVAQQVEAVVAAHSNWPRDIYVAGEPIMHYRGTRNMRRDLLIFIPITLVLIITVFYLSFRTWRAVLLPLLTVALAVIWTFGLMAWLGKSLTVVTLSLPVVILAIGSSYVIHVINQYYLSTAQLGEGAGSEEKRRSVFDALAFIGGAVLVSGTTTMAGFLSLTTTDIQGSREMGYFAAFGILATTILALTFVPACLVLLKTPRTKVGRTDYAPYLDGLLRELGYLTTERQRVIYLGTGLVCLIGLAGAMQLQINTDYLSFFKRGTPVYAASEKLHRNLAGAATFELVIDGGRPDSIIQLPVLQAMRELQQYALTQGADASVSLADVVTALNRSLTGASNASLPADKRRLDELYQDYLSHDEAVRRFVTADGARAVIVMRTNFFASNEMRLFLRQVEEYARTVLPQNFAVNSTGTFVLLNRASDKVAGEQTRSLTLALLLILVMITLLFRSLKLGVIALIPNVIPILFTFGFMGWTGIYLDINTSLVASIMLGLAVDNAVHLMVRFMRTRTQASGNKEAVILTLAQSGKPVIFANLTLIFAFTIFTLSLFRPVQLSGILSVVTILASLVGNLLLLPVLLTLPALRVGVDRFLGQPLPAALPKVKQSITEEEIKLR